LLTFFSRKPQVRKKWVHEPNFDSVENMHEKKHFSLVNILKEKNILKTFKTTTAKEDSLCSPTIF